MNLESLTSKKVAGIPVLPVIFVVAAIGLYLAIKSKNTTATPAVDPNATPAIAGDGTDTNQPVFNANIPTLTNPSGVNSGSVVSTPGPDTDDLWSRRAIGYLIANGYSLEVATSAITKYLAGGELTSTEGQARDKAVQVFGLPPETLPASTTDPKATVPTVAAPSPPASKQGTPPVTHTVKGTRDNTYGALAQLYYGFTGSGSLIEIEGANPGAHAPFGVGTQIKIPKLHAPVYYKSTSATHTLYQIAQKNAISPATLQALNPGRVFPVSIGSRVRVS